MVCSFLVMPLSGFVRAMLTLNELENVSTSSVFWARLCQIGIIPYGNVCWSSSGLRGFCVGGFLTMDSVSPIDTVGSLCLSFTSDSAAAP